jgi:glucans biosynthesis protein
MGEDSTLPPLGRVISTRIADISYNPKAKRFILDFGGHELTDEAKFEEIIADVSAINGKILGKFMHRNEYARGVRVFFDAEPENTNAPVELRCFIKDSTKPLSETWSYQWIP